MHCDSRYDQAPIARIVRLLLRYSISGQLGVAFKPLCVIKRVAWNPVVESPEIRREGCNVPAPRNRRPSNR